MDNRHVADRIINHIIDNLKIYGPIGFMAMIVAFFHLKSSDEQYILFHKSEFNGQIISKDQHKGIAEIRVQGDSVTQEFLPIDDDNPEKFNSFVRIGDSIYKAPYADSIHLFRNGKRYSWKIYIDADIMANANGAGL